MFSAKLRTSFASVGLAAALCVTASCTVRGSGVASSEERTVEAFTEVDVGGALQVDIVVGHKMHVEVHGDDNIVPLIQTKIVGDELLVSATKGISPKADLRIEIKMPSLEALDAGGASTVLVTGLHGSEFELDVSGASRAVLSGEVDDLDLDASGASNVDANALQAKRADLDVSGASDVEVSVVETLNVDASGASDVHYNGSPKVTTDVSGAASVEPKD